MRIVGIGAGPAGLYFALLMKLQDSANDVTLLERHPAGVTPGFGVTFGAGLLRELHHGDPVSARQVEQAMFRCSGQIVEVSGEQVPTAAGGAHAISRHRLLDILASRATDLGVRIEFGHEVQGTTRLPAADLTLICDGGNSRARQEAGVFQTSVRTGSNKVIWLGTDLEFPAFTFSFVHTSSGWIWAYSYGNGDGTSTLNVECSPVTWTGLRFDTLPVRTCLGQLGQIFERQLDGHPLFAQERDSQEARWLNFRTVTNQRWQHGSMVLAGDAAHTTHFSIGSGTTLAIEDAIALAGSLRQHGELSQALAAYQRQRQAALRQRQRDARFSARWFENVPRYIGLPPHQFARLLHARRSPLVARLPPRLSAVLLQAGHRVQAGNPPVANPAPPPSGQQVGR